jgi:perosamine synthetase
MNFFASYVSPNAAPYVAVVLRSTMLSEGEWVRRFEAALEGYLRLKSGVVCTNSGTSALHLALATLGVGAGDEVIIPPLTFVATGLAVLYRGATPIFCDIASDGCIDPKKIPALITERTKAIIAVNWAGKACQISALEKIAKKHGVKLVIDAAQSFGHGMGGDITCFSFQATKHLTTGDGGAVVCKPEYYEKARRLNWFGIDKAKDAAGPLGERIYNLDEVGYKYHMNNVAAAIGLANLQTVHERNDHRRAIADIYSKELLCPMYADPMWAFPINVRDVDAFTRVCFAQNVPVSIIHRGIDHNHIFGGIRSGLTEMRKWEREVTHLPIHHEITKENAYWICERIKDYV